MAMNFAFIKRKPVATDRLLEMRERAGDDPGKHERYHRAVNRYQRVVLKAYYLRRRSFLARCRELWNRL